MAQKKLKVKKSVKRRFKITKTGKVLRRGAHARHLRRKKKKSRTRAQKVPQTVSGAWKRKIKKLMGA